MPEENVGFEGELYVLTSDSCNACKEFKEIFRGDLESGKIKELKLETEEGRRIALTLGVKEVPSFIKKEGGKVCLLDDKMNVVKCEEVKDFE